jgi:hypothetical protein
VIPYGHHFYVQPAPLDQGLEAPAHDIDHRVPGILAHQLGHGREGADNVADGAIPGNHHKFLLLNCGNTQETKPKNELADFKPTRHRQLEAHRNHQPI